MLSSYESVLLVGSTETWGLEGEKLAGKWFLEIARRLACLSVAGSRHGSSTACHMRTRGFLDTVFFQGLGSVRSCFNVAPLRCECLIEQ